MTSPHMPIFVVMNDVIFGRNQVIDSEFFFYGTIQKISRLFRKKNQNSAVFGHQTG